MRALRKVLAFSAGSAVVTATWNAVTIASTVNVSDVFLVVSAVLALLIYRLEGSERQINLAALWIAGPVLACVACAAIQTVGMGLPFFSPQAEAGAAAGISGLLFVTKVLFSTLLIALVARPAVQFGWARLILALWLLGSAINVSVSDLQFWTHSTLVSLPSQTFGLGLTRAPGLTTHPNSLAQVAVLGVVIAFLFVATATHVTRYLALSAVGLCLSGLWSAGSRAGLIVGLFSTILAVGLLAARKGLVISIISCSAMLAVLLAILPSVIATSRLATADTGAGESDDARSAAIAAGAAKFAGSPVFGAGLGSWFGELAPLILLACGGLLLSVSYLIFFLGLFRNCLSQRPVERSFAFLYLVALIAMLFLNNGLFERYIFWPPLIVVFESKRVRELLRADMARVHQRAYGTLRLQ